MAGGLFLAPLFGRRLDGLGSLLGGMLLAGTGGAVAGGPFLAPLFGRRLDGLGSLLGGILLARKSSQSSAFGGLKARSHSIFRSIRVLGPKARSHSAFGVSESLGQKKKLAVTLLSEDPRKSSQPLSSRDPGPWTSQDRHAHPRSAKPTSNHTGLDLHAKQLAKYLKRLG